MEEKLDEVVALQLEKFQLRISQLEAERQAEEARFALFKVELAHRLGLVLGRDAIDLPRRRIVRHPPAPPPARPTLLRAVEDPHGNG